MPNNDVTVNISGNAEQLKRELADVQNSIGGSMDLGNLGAGGGRGAATPRGGSAGSAPDNRLVEQIRQGMSDQGVIFVPGSNYKSIVNQTANNQRAKIDEEITQKYDNKRNDLKQNREQSYSEIETEIDQLRKTTAENMGSNWNDPLARKAAEMNIKAEANRQFTQVDKQYGVDLGEIDEEEKTERVKADTELTEAIKELTKELGHREPFSGDPNSFINTLKQEKENLESQRDSAGSEAEAIAHQAKINEIDERLRGVMGSGRPQAGVSVYDSLAAGTGGMVSALSSAGQGDIGGTVMGGTLAYTGIARLGLAAALKLNAVAAVVAATAGAIRSGGETADALSGLAAYRSTVDGQAGNDAFKAMPIALRRTDQYGLGFKDYGIKWDDFVKTSEARVRARGTSENWQEETITGMALEKGLAMEKGSLTQGGQYDRYGQNVTDALARMVTVLEGIEGSGVTEENFVRVQEKFDIQQSIMQGYMDRTDKPNYDVANNMLAAFSATKGITQDQRVGSDIQQFQNMVQNPMGDRMKALVYNAVTDIMPQTEGRIDLIQRAIAKPENEAKIIKAVIEAVTRQYGGTNTPMGFLAMQQALGGITPDRRDAYINGILNGEPGKILKDTKFKKGEPMHEGVTHDALINKQEWSAEAAGLISGYTKNMAAFIAWVKSGKLAVTLNDNTFSSPKPPTTKSGGN